MRRRLRSLPFAALIPLLTFPLSSCSYSFEIEVSGFGPNIRLEFRDGGLLKSSRQVTCLKRLTVHEQFSPGGQDGPVWQIAASKGCVTLTGIDVGHVPDGFVEEINQLPLKSGHVYQAEASAEKKYPDSGISSRWFVCKTSPVEADWKNESELREMPLHCVR